MMVCTCHHNYVGGVSRRIAVKPGWRWGLGEETLSKKQLKKKGLGAWLK
jgi:hypothetical protein